MTPLTLDLVAPAAAAGQDLAELIDVAQAYARMARAPRTVAAYASDWRLFSAWCARRGLERLPATPMTIASYIAEQAASGRRPSTIQRRLVAINREHKIANYPLPTSSPEVKEVLIGVRRAHGTAPDQVAALLTEDLKGILAVIPDTVRGARNRALLLLGFAGAFRRTELVSLNKGDLEFKRNGMVVTVRRAKNDQEAQSRRIGIPYGSTELTCPIRAMQRWLELAEIRRGAIFREVDRHGNIGRERLSDRTVARLVKEHVALVGLDPALYAGHSLRAGLATSASAGGASDREVMRQTGHTSLSQVSKYMREGRLFLKNAATMAGL